MQRPESLLDAWARWKPRRAPFLLDTDREAFRSRRSRDSTVTRTSCRKAIRASDFAAPGDTRVHLGLLPQPFVGDLRRAKVYILLLNPGLGSGNYFAEYEVPAFRKAILSTIRQRFTGKAPRFLFLDPRFAWDGGFQWWHGKLARVIERLAKRWKVPYARARTRLANSLASIELFPYHSASFRDGDRWLRNLTSVTLARNFVHDVVLPRVRSGKAILIVTRKLAAWRLPRCRGVVRYRASEARAAHLTPESRGGKAILRHLAKRR